MYWSGIVKAQNFSLEKWRNFTLKFSPGGKNVGGRQVLNENLSPCLDSHKKVQQGDWLRSLDLATGIQKVDFGHRHRNEVA